MATNFRNSAGTDFDDLFDPYVAGTVPSNTGFRTSDGVDLAGRYAPLSFGTKRADVNYRTSAGTDLSNLWAQKGSASYVSNPLPGALTCARSNPGVSTLASVNFQFNRDGTASWADEYPPVTHTGSWTTNSPTAGDAYEIRITTLSTDGGTISGAPGTWQALSTSRIVKYTTTVPAGSSVAYTTQVRYEIRRTGTTTDLLDTSIYLYLIVDT